MAKKNSTSKIFDDLISSVKSQIVVSGLKLPDIINFCESPTFLNLLNNPGNPIELFPFQKIALKSFYRGTQGNENIELTEDEISLLKKENMEYVLDKFNSKEIHRQLVLVWGRRCISEDTEFENPNTGEVNSIGELWNRGIREIDTISLDEETYNFSKTKSDIFYNGVKPIYRLTTNSGRKIDVTENHPFLTVNGWKRLDELTVKDRIAVPGCELFFGENELKPEEASLIGYMTGDGCFTTSQLDFACNNNKVLDHFDECLKKIDNNLIISHSGRYNYKVKNKQEKWCS